MALASNKGLVSAPRIILDTGPLVAFLARGEAGGDWAEAQFAESRPPLLTCEPVLTEAMFLLSRHRAGTEQLFALMDSGLLEVNFSVMSEKQALVALMAKYMALPMSLTDACLVRMAELSPAAAVLTFDRHFRVYRMHGRQVIPVIMPDE